MHSAHISRRVMRRGRRHLSKCRCFSQRDVCSLEKKQPAAWCWAHLRRQLIESSTLHDAPGSEIPSIYNALGLLGSDLPFGEDLDVYRFQTSVEPQPQNIPEPKKERKGP